MGFGTLKHPQANGLAERMVKTVKALMENSTDPYMALLSYHATPMPWWTKPCRAINGEKDPDRSPTNNSQSYATMVTCQER